MHNACHVFELNFEVYNSGPHISCHQLPSRALELSNGCSWRKVLKSTKQSQEVQKVLKSTKSTNKVTTSTITSHATSCPPGLLGPQHCGCSWTKSTVWYSKVPNRTKSYKKYKKYQQVTTSTLTSHAISCPPGFVSRNTQLSSGCSWRKSTQKYQTEPRHIRKYYISQIIAPVALQSSSLSSSCSLCPFF